jgi:hypothetical protein
MATYHVIVVARRAEWPGTLLPPFAPWDVTADSEADAMAKAAAMMLDDANFGRPIDEIADPTRDWQPIARLVHRAAIELRPHRTAVDILQDGIVVGTHYNYGEETGTEAFDVLADGIVRGRLERHADEPSLPPSGGRNVLPFAASGRPGGRMWRIADAEGPLAPLARRRWPDHSPGGLSRTLDWLGTVLADIRGALEMGEG